MLYKNSRYETLSDAMRRVRERRILRGQSESVPRSL